MIPRGAILSDGCTEYLRKIGISVVEIPKREYGGKVAREKVALMLHERRFLQHFATHAPENIFAVGASNNAKACVAEHGQLIHAKHTRIPAIVYPPLCTLQSCILFKDLLQ